jgi:pyruvate formate lyase activating enzyme
MIKYERCISCSLIGPKCNFGVLNVHYSESGSIGYNHASIGTVDPMICPNKAVRIIGQEYYVNEILNEVIEDVVFYDFSGGGITVSGGEPMAQFDFTYELLKASKGSGINTCLDTSGDAPTEQYLRIMPQVDLFLYDYKMTDPDLHYNFTGSSNMLILENLDAILSHGGRVILRCPIVPGVNDNSQHFSGIARITSKYPNIEAVELLAYHDVGRYKHKELGKHNTDDDLMLKMGVHLPTDNDYRRWVEILHSLGCDRIISNS